MELEIPQIGIAGNVRIGDYLVEQGLADREAVEAAVMESRITGERIGNILVRNGFLQLRRPGQGDPEAVARIHRVRKGVQRPHPARPAGRIQHRRVGRDRAPTSIFRRLRTRTVVREMAEKYYPDKTLVFVSLSPGDLSNFIEGINRENDESAMDKVEDDAEIIEMIMKKAILVGASDIHIEPRLRSYTVFFRHLGIRKIIHEGSAGTVRRAGGADQGPQPHGPGGNPHPAGWRLHHGVPQPPGRPARRDGADGQRRSHRHPSCSIPTRRSARWRSSASPRSTTGAPPPTIRSACA